MEANFTPKNPKKPYEKYGGTQNLNSNEFGAKDGAMQVEGFLAAGRHKNPLSSRR